MTRWNFKTAGLEESVKRVFAINRFFWMHPLTRDNVYGAWVRFIRWQIRSRLYDEVTVPWIEGQRLVVRRGMTGATGNIYAGLHEFYDMMLPLHFLRPGDLFYDIGANVGAYTVIASGVCGASTWTFEPDPRTVRNLQRNIEVNNLNEIVVVHECALGSSNGNVKFTTGRDTTNRVAGEDDVGVCIVPQRTLDDISGKCIPIMLKIDVEGYEENVIAGAKNVLSNEGLKVIELETANDSVFKTLASHGFVQCEYDPFGRELRPNTIAKRSSNFAFVRDVEFVQKRLSSAKAVKVLGRTI